MLVTHACWVLLGCFIGTASVYFLPEFAVMATLGAAILILLSAIGNASLGYVVLFAIVPLLWLLLYAQQTAIIPFIKAQSRFNMISDVILKAG